MVGTHGARPFWAHREAVESLGPFEIAQALRPRLDYVVAARHHKHRKVRKVSNVTSFKVWPTPAVQ